MKKQNKDLMEKLDGAIRTEVKNGNEKISTDSIKRYEELLSKLTEFDKELEKRNVESVADLKSEFEFLSEVKRGAKHLTKRSRIIIQITRQWEMHSEKK